MRIFKFTFLLFCLLSATSIFSQEEDAKPAADNEEALPAQKRQFYVFSPRISVTVPHPMSNKAFRKSFVGIYEVSGGLNIAVFKGAFIGVTYKNGLMRITENKIPDLEASMQFNNAGVKVGTDVFVGERNRIIFSAAVTAGKNWTKFTSFDSKTSGGPEPLKGFTTTYVEPEVNFFFLVEQNFGIGATVSYSMFNQKFNPYDLNLNEWSQFDKENPGNIQYLSFGFGFYYSFLKKKTPASK